MNLPNVHNPNWTPLYYPNKGIMWEVRVWAFVEVWQHLASVHFSVRLHWPRARNGVSLLNTSVVETRREKHAAATPSIPGQTSDTIIIIIQRPHRVVSMYGCHCHSTSPLSSVLRRGVKSQCKCDLMFKVYPVIFCLQYVIAPVLLLAHFQSPWQLQKYNESPLSLLFSLSLSAERMY